MFLFASSGCSVFQPDFQLNIEEAIVVVLVPINDHRRKNTHVIHGIRSLIDGELVEILGIFFQPHISLWSSHLVERINMKWVETGVH